MANRDDVRVCGPSTAAALCSESGVMRGTVTGHTDHLLMLSALDCVGLYRPVAISKVDDAVEAICRVVPEQKVIFSGEVA